MPLVLRLETCSTPFVPQGRATPFFLKSETCPLKPAMAILVRFTDCDDYSVRY